MKPCLQYDGTSWRCGPKRLSERSAMKRLKIMHMMPPVRERLLKEKRDKLARLRKEHQELEEECKMLSEYERV